MNDFEQKIIHSIKKMVYEAEERAYQSGIITYYETIPYIADDYFEYTLDDDGSKITFLIYEMTEERDYQFQIKLEDGLHKEQIINLPAEEDKFLSIASVLIEHYIMSNWIETMAEIEVISIAKFVKKYRNNLYTN